MMAATKDPGTGAPSAAQLARQKLVSGFFDSEPVVYAPQVASLSLGTHQENAVFYWGVTLGCAVGPNSAVGSPPSMPTAIMQYIPNQGLVTGTYTTGINAPEDGAPNGVTSATLSVTFTPTTLLLPNAYSWDNVVTNDPFSGQKSPYDGSPVPYTDDPGNTGSFEGNFPNGYKNGTIPVYSGGGINFYDNPQNPVGYPVGFNTSLVNKTNGNTVVTIIWQLPGGG
jgi:hypothetical protein